jgi:hypothetical protein
VTFSGTATGAIDRLTFDVTDEYGRIQPSGSASFSNGRFSITIPLEASRRGDDPDGRRYTVRVTAWSGGQQVSATAVAIVPHDLRGRAR